jgi:fatty acid CoA ligase FadD9
MRALPEEQRQQSVLAILEPYSHPQTPGTKSQLPAERFRIAVQDAGFDMPHLSSKLINKYVADLRHLNLL